MHLASMLAVCSLTQTPSLVPKYDQDKKYNDAVAQHVTMCKEPISLFNATPTAEYLQA